DDARRRRQRSAFPHRLAADHAPRLLRHRHAGAGQAFGRDPRSRRHAQIHRRRFARLPLGRGHLSRHGRKGPRSGAAAIHRSLLHRRISDPADRPHRAGRLAAPTLAARRSQLKPSSAMSPLADRIALVTGASRGIGYATALKLARAGAHVVAVARTVGGLEELDDAVRKAGSSATLVPLDMRDYDGFYRLASALNERYQRLDVLVGNAAVGGQRSPLDHVMPPAWDE